MKLFGKPVEQTDLGVDLSDVKFSDFSSMTASVEFSVTGEDNGLIFENATDPTVLVVFSNDAGEVVDTKRLTFAEFDSLLRFIEMWKPNNV